ncbi:DUF4139 domain-containing protein [soil metagenome]
MKIEQSSARRATASVGRFISGGASVLLAWSLGAPATAATDDAAAVALTIYSSAEPGSIPPELYRPAPGGAIYPPGNVPGYAIVRQDRLLELSRGRQELRFRDVAALIDPTTVRFESLTDPEGTRVLEQNFQFDLVSAEKLVNRYLDREVTVERDIGDDITTLTGRLLGTQGGLTLEGRDGQIHLVQSYAAIRFPELPGGLITRPTLVWELTAERAGEHQTRVSYETHGMTWWADYNLTFREGRDANSGLLDVSAWVSIINQSGASYPEAQLKLVAGDVQRVTPERAYRSMNENAVKMAADREAGFAEKPFFEFHLYTLGRPTTLPDNSTKQLELFPDATGVPAEKLLVYYGLGAGFGGFFPDPVLDRDFGNQSNPKVDIYLRFENLEQHGLGIPLPAGRLRVAKQDEEDDSLEFIGEDVIDHTPKDEKVLIRLGSAFDVVGERKQVDYQVDVKARRLEETIEIELRNHKEEPVQVLVRENLYRWLTWEIVNSSIPFDKVDARTIEFPLRVAADDEQTLRYTVRYSW